MQSKRGVGVKKFMSQSNLKLQALTAVNQTFKWIDSQVEEANKTKEGKVALLAMDVLGKACISGLIYSMTLPIALAYEGTSYLVDKGITRIVGIYEGRDSSSRLEQGKAIAKDALAGGRRLWDSIVSSGASATLWYNILHSNDSAMNKTCLTIAAVFRGVTWRVFQTDKVSKMTKVLFLKLAKVAAAALILKSLMLISAYTFAVILFLNFTILPLLYVGSILLQQNRNIPERIKLFKPDSFNREVIKTLLQLSQVAEEAQQ